MAVDAAANFLVVANGGTGSVALFRADDCALLGRVELVDDADNTRVNVRFAVEVIVGYGQGALAIIDPSTRSKIADVRRDGTGVNS